MRGPSLTFEIFNISNISYFYQYLDRQVLNH